MSAPHPLTAGQLQAIAGRAAEGHVSAARLRRDVASLVADLRLRERQRRLNERRLAAAEARIAALAADLAEENSAAEALESLRAQLAGFVADGAAARPDGAAAPDLGGGYDGGYAAGFFDAHVDVLALLLEAAGEVDLDDADVERRVIAFAREATP